MSNSVIVIHEKDHEDNSRNVIGVASTVENAQKIIDTYYGDYKELQFIDIRDSNLEWSKRLEVIGAYKKTYEVTVTLEWFELNGL